MLAVMMRTSRKATLLGGLVALVALALATDALALSGTTLKLAEAEFYEPPAVAVDSAGTAYIAWANAATTPDKVEYCVLPAGASSCSHAGTLTPAGGSGAHIDNVQVLVDESASTIVILADVYGVSEKNTPEQEWTAPTGGTTFNLVNSGKSVAEGILSADTEPLNALLVPGTNALGYAWVTAAGPPTFAEFPLTPPSECSVQAGHTCPFATLQPEGEHILSNHHGVFASQLGTNPGILGVYETLGKPGCPTGSFDTAYVYGSGVQEANNSYNISPGEPKSAWRMLLAPGNCEVEYVAAGGGPSGLGVVEDDLETGSTVYERFDQTDDGLDTPYVTIAPEGEESPSVSQDGSGGIYATFTAGLDEVRLAYSGNGGANWAGPTTLSSMAVSHLVSAVSAGGQGWAVWQSGESVYAQQFDAADATPPSAPTTLTTTQTSGTTSGASITIPAGTVGETDQATLSGTNAAVAGGTVTYDLYSSSSCTGTPVFTSTGAVTAGKAAASAPVSAGLSLGTYYWEAAYGGDSRNDPSTSACGSEVLTVAAPAPSSEFTVKAIVTNSNGTITITIVVTQSGEATLEITISTTTLANSAAVDAKSKRCKHGQIKLKGKCVSATTVVGKTSAKATAGVPLKLTVHLSNKIKKLLKKGKTVHLTGKLSFQSALGGKPVTHSYSLLVKGVKRKHKK